MTIRTILVDDEPLATQGLQLRLQAHEDLEVVGTAANGREDALALLLKLRFEPVEGFVDRHADTVHLRNSGL